MNPISINVKTTSSTSNISQTVTPSNTTISSLKQSVVSALHLNPSRRLRLIWKGKMLQPDSEYLAKFNIQDGDFVHCVVSPEGSVPSLMQPTISSASDNGEEDDVDLENPRGFDTLLASGLSRAEITAIRAYFNSEVDAYARTAETVAGESEGDRVYRMEAGEVLKKALPKLIAFAANKHEHEHEHNTTHAEWMARQGNGSEFRLNTGSRSSASGSSTGSRDWGGNESNVVGSTIISSSLGTQRDFVWGFILGFFVGFFLLFWIWMPTVSHRQKLGILAGIGAQMFFNMLIRDGAESLSGGPPPA